MIAMKSYVKHDNTVLYDSALRSNTIDDWLYINKLYTHKLIFQFIILLGLYYIMIKLS